MRASTWLGSVAFAVPIVLVSCGAPRASGDGRADSTPTDTATGGASTGGGAGSVCAAPCVGDMTCCSGACFDLRNDAAHCGSCSAVCNTSATEVCAAGRCGAVNWALWPMPNGQGDTSSGAPNPNDYSDSLDGTVWDRVTNLVWQQRIPVTGGANDDGYLTWSEARDYCATLPLAGHDDWRVPSQIELVSLLDYSNLGAAQPPIDSMFFANVPADAFWSSTQSADLPMMAWTVYMDVGFTYAYDKSTVGRVRCVR